VKKTIQLLLIDDNDAVLEEKWWMTDLEKKE
jgi:hypothetical protein